MEKLTDTHLNSVIGIVNKGYKITQSRVMVAEFTDSSNYGFVLGYNAEAGLYVTWRWHLVDKEPSFYWGHYYETKAAALADYESRE